MEKLNLKSKMLHDLMYLVWIIAGYYEKLFAYTVPEKASDLDVQITNQDGITRLYFKFPRILDQQPVYPVEQMVHLFNHHLYYDLLSSAGMPKYRASSLPHDVVEAFIVNKAFADSDFITIEIIHVDNPIAYDFIYQNSCI